MRRRRGRPGRRINSSRRVFVVAHTGRRLARTVICLCPCVHVRMCVCAGAGVLASPCARVCVCLCLCLCVLVIYPSLPTCFYLCFYLCPSYVSIRPSYVSIRRCRRVPIRAFMFCPALPKTPPCSLFRSERNNYALGSEIRQLLWERSGSFGATASSLPFFTGFLTRLFIGLSVWCRLRICILLSSRLRPAPGLRAVVSCSLGLGGASTCFESLGWAPLALWATLPFLFQAQSATLLSLVKVLRLQHQIAGGVLLEPISHVERHTII